MRIIPGVVQSENVLTNRQPQNLTNNRYIQNNYFNDPLVEEGTEPAEANEGLNREDDEASAVLDRKDSEQE